MRRFRRAPFVDPINIVPRPGGYRMSTASARGRGGAKPSRGPGKIIPLPTPRVVRRQRAIKAATAALALGLTAAILARLYISRTSPLSPEEIAGLSTQESEIIKLVNDERVRAGLMSLKFSPRLAVMARGHSYDMAIRRYFAHNSPEGSTPADRLRGVGLTYQELAENIYMEDYHDSGAALPPRALKGWLASPEHRANMLSPGFRETGVGIARSSDGKAYVTQDFVR
jgi:uncharacterized protein YkwD